MNHPDNIFYVYVHKKEKNGEVFYVGKGKGGRANSLSGRNNHWKKTVEKYGYYTEYIAKELDEQSSFNLEIETIKKLKKEGFNLCNYSTGGEGCSGVIHTKETKEKFRKAKAGKKQSKEHAKKSAIAKTGKKQPKSAVEYVSSLKRKSVINSNGVVYKSCSEAARILNLSQGNISTCARGERRECAGLAWSYDLLKIPKLIKHTNKKMVLKVNDGQIFESVGNATQWVINTRGTASHQCISEACRKSGNAYGYKWEYVNRPADEI